MVWCVAGALVLAGVCGAEAARSIEDRFVAPCCWRGSVAEHQSPAAQAMRVEIGALIRAGRGEEEIVRIFVARYGERILREPRGLRQFWLTVTPLAALSLGLAWLLRFLVRNRRPENPL